MCFHDFVRGFKFLPFDFSFLPIVVVCPLTLYNTFLSCTKKEALKKKKKLEMVEFLIVFMNIMLSRNLAIETVVF